MRIVLLVNPGSGSAPDPADLAAALAAGGNAVETLEVEQAGRVAALAPERVVIASGDGSIGLAAGAASACGAQLAVVPSGTANDFARALGIPLERDAAVALARDPVAAVAPVDLARADGRPFLNAANYGLAVDAAEAADRLKPALGPAAYAAGAVKAGLTGDPLDARVIVDGEPLWAGPAWQVIVAGTGSFGGGSHLDRATPDDGLLDVAVVPAGSRASLLRRAAGLRRGTLADQDDVVHGRGRAVEVEAAGAVANVDGEVLEPAPRRLETGAERVLVVAP